MKLENLNQELLIKNKVSIRKQQKLLKLYDKLDKQFAKARRAKQDNVLTFELGHKIANKVEEIEFKLQKNWNFNQSRNYHKYQDEIPGCICGYIDNQDLYGTGARWVHQKCRFHGYNPNVKINESKIGNIKSIRKAN